MKTNEIKELLGGNKFPFFYFWRNFFSKNNFYSGAKPAQALFFIIDVVKNKLEYLSVLYFHNSIF